MPEQSVFDAEARRLLADAKREQNWKYWGLYLAERQWGTVREDYSEYGTCWDYFPHDHACSRVYRWGEDGLLGITDRECRLCFALALWNGRDSILKERLFGLTAAEGNHGEDGRFASDPCWRHLVLFYEYFHGEHGRGLGASHQTGWTALVTRCLEDLAKTAYVAPSG
jgi:hypothetical protein